jgi:hypothetical protein
MTMKDRSDYSPDQRANSLSKVKSYQAYNNYEANQRPNTTVHKPGSGGFQPGAYAQGVRQAGKRYEEDRAESYRPEYGETEAEDVNNENDNKKETNRPEPQVTAKQLAKAAKSKYV